jgi:hypothetical protein
LIIFDFTNEQKFNYGKFDLKNKQTMETKSHHPNNNKKKRKKRHTNNNNDNYIDIHCCTSKIDMKQLGWSGGILIEDKNDFTQIIKRQQQQQQSEQSTSKRQKIIIQPTSSNSSNKRDRITIPISTRNDIILASKLTNEFTIVAVRPLSIEAISWIVDECENNNNFDLISINLSLTNYSILLQSNTLKLLLKSGIFLEICTSDLFIHSDMMPTTLHQRISTAKSLAYKATHRLIIISTGATNDNEIRSVDEMQLICKMIIGMKTKDIVESMTCRIKELQYRAAKRRSMLGLVIL